MLYRHKIVISLLLLIYLLNIVSGLNAKENLGRSINSSTADFIPVLTQDESMMFFTRKNHVQNYGIDKNEDIWYSKKLSNGEWSKAVNIGSPLNTTGPNSIFACSPKGDTVYLTNSYLKNHTHERSPSFSVRTDSGWSFPQKINIENYDNMNEYASFSMSPDNQYLLLAIETSDSKGGLDIYVSFRKRGNLWSEPLNLGQDINTRFDDTSPFIGPDNKSFYFSSLGHNPNNDYDVYISKRIDNSWQKWTIPKNLGPKVNTRNGEANFYYTSDTGNAYFSTTDDSYGSWDIFSIPMSSDFKTDFTFLMSGRLLKEKYSLEFKDSIFYEINTELEANILKHVSPDIQYALPLGIHFGILDKDDGMIYITETFDVTSSNIKSNMDRNGILSRQELLDKVFMLYFDFAKYDLDSTYQKELNYLINILVTFPEFKLKIVGHADNNGSETGNDRVSQARANAVRDYLMQEGILEERLIMQYYGDKRPFAPNNTERQRQINRRVEINFVK